jgi:predicted choloylglycine hydrolase
LQRLAMLTGDDDLAVRLLGCWQPPAYLLGCSQAALVGCPNPVLARNYDLRPDLNEGVIIRTAWSGRQVLGTSEFLWGLADGMNEDGLALSLAFGGSREVGPGFGITLILRYVLEVCATVADALEVLARLPSHMAYNVTLLDRHGAARTVQLAPTRRCKILDLPVATNHQGTPRWTEYARFTATLEREAALRKVVEQRDAAACHLLQALLDRPLYNTDYRNGFGTLYTVRYFPNRGLGEWHWPGFVIKQAIDRFEERSVLIRYSDRGAEALVGRASSDPRVVVRQPLPGPLRTCLAAMYRGGPVDWIAMGQRLATFDWRSGAS